MVEIPNISEGLVSGFCDFVTKNKFAGTGRVLERLEHVYGLIICTNKYVMCRFLFFRIVS